MAAVTRMLRLILEAPHLQFELKILRSTFDFSSPASLRPSKHIAKENGPHGHVCLCVVWWGAGGQPGKKMPFSPPRVQGDFFCWRSKILCGINSRLIREPELIRKRLISSVFSSVEGRFWSEPYAGFLWCSLVHRLLKINYFYERLQWMVSEGKL